MITPPYLNDTSRMDSADSSLFSAIKNAGEDRKLLSEAIANFTKTQIRAAVEVILSEDTTRCRQVILVGILAKSKRIVDFAMDRAKRK